MGKGSKSGFTLIELAIVLVVIGLIVGGVMMGRSLIFSAAIRAQIGQIARYDAAIDTFRDKYGGLPGDLPITPATQAGFSVANCSGGSGQRNGDGLIDGGYGAGTYPYSQLQNETGLFWQDLSQSGLIPDTIQGVAPPITCGGNNSIWGVGTSYGAFFPGAKVGFSGSVYVYDNAGHNWFGISQVIGWNANGSVGTAPFLTVMQAYQLDSKMDDGNPYYGNVQANYMINADTLFWSAPGVSVDDPTTCLHWWVGGKFNPGYSITVNDGTGVNCALSFRFQ